MAQELVAIAPSTATAGSQFRLRFEVDAKAGNFKEPSFGGLEVLSGPSTSSSSSTTIINGKVDHHVSNAFNYLVRAEKEGTYTIGAASCTVDGKTIKSQPVTVKVVKGSSSPTRSGAYDRQQQQQQQAVASVDSKSLFARTSVSKSNPYQGEEVIISYKIYTQLSLHQYQIEKLPGNKGFWSEDLSEGRDIKQYEEDVNGRHYVVAEIRRGAIFGQETGKQRIEPLDLNVLAMVPVQRRRTGTIWDLFDDPFFNQAQAMEKKISTNAVQLNVRPLPPCPAGKVFGGGVGKFGVKASVDHNEVKANEAVTFRITVNGHGNLMLIDAPEIVFPKAFEVYDPKVTDNINRGDNGISGSRTFEWVLIPQTQGSYTIPSYDFTYFDPTSGKYVTESTPSFDIKVSKGNAADRLVSSGKSDVKLINNDINHIKSHLGRTLSGKSQVSVLQWLLMALVVAASLVVILLGRKRQALEQDEVGLRQRRALKLARRRLRNAEKLLSDNNDNLFYEEIYKALWGCLSDKYSIPLSQLSRESVSDKLNERHIPEEKMQLVMSTLQSVDEARFAPGDSSARKQAIYDHTLQTIATL